MSTTNIIVIGAGMAGLSTANTLMAAGFTVMVLEASHRYGDRIAINEALGVSIGYGATWLHGGDQNPLWPLVRQYATKTTPFDTKKFYCFDRYGKRIPVEQVAIFEDKFATAVADAMAWAVQKNQPLALADALADFLHPEVLSELEQVHGSVK